MADPPSAGGALSPVSGRCIVSAADVGQEVAQGHLQRPVGQVRVARCSQSRKPAAHRSQRSLPSARGVPSKISTASWPRVGTPAPKISRRVPRVPTPRLPQGFRAFRPPNPPMRFEAFRLLVPSDFSGVAAAALGSIESTWGILVFPSGCLAREEVEKSELHRESARVGQSPDRFHGFERSKKTPLGVGLPPV